LPPSYLLHFHKCGGALWWSKVKLLLHSLQHL
jgi:hypothetical protein